MQQAHVEKLLGKYGTIQRLDMLPTSTVAFVIMKRLESSSNGNLKFTWKKLTQTNTQGAVGESEITPRSTISGSWNRSRGMSNKTTSLDHRIQALKTKTERKEVMVVGIADFCRSKCCGGAFGDNLWIL